jgi:hypothetical protein
MVVAGESEGVGKEVVVGKPCFLPYELKKEVKILG